MNMPKVSIIIPVYNTAQYLSQCLDSVLSQTINSLELLCIDDGSTDNSLSILQEYAAKDERIRFFCQENKGSGAARNLGLSEACGEYIAFMDGDDFYPDSNVLDSLYNAAKKNDCAIAAGYRTLLTDEGQHADAHDPLYKRAENMEEGEMVKYCNVQNDFNYQCYLFKRSLLTDNNITFPDYLRCQDPPFFVRAMTAAGKFFLIPQSSYVYRWGHQNIQWNKRKINDMMQAHIDLLRISRDADLPLLHQTVASRLETKYSNNILSNLNLSNLKLFPKNEKQNIEVT